MTAFCYSKYSYTDASLTHCFAFLLQTLRSELKEREHLVVSTLDQARMFLADQPIEGPGEPRKNLQPKTGTFKLSMKTVNKKNEKEESHH